MSSISDFEGEAPIIVYGPYEGKDGGSADEFDETLAVPLYLADQSQHNVDVDTQPTDVVGQDQEERMQVPMGSFEEFSFSGVMVPKYLVPGIPTAPGYTDIDTGNIKSNWSKYREALCLWTFGLESRIISPEGAGYAVRDAVRDRTWEPNNDQGVLCESVEWTWEKDAPKELEWRMEMVMQEGVQQVRDDAGPITYIQDEFDSQFKVPKDMDGSDMFDVNPSNFPEPDKDKLVVPELGELPNSWDVDGSGFVNLGIVEEKRYEREVNIEKTQQLSGMGDGSTDGSQSNMGTINSGVQATMNVQGKMHEEELTASTAIPPDKQSLEGFCEWLAGTRSARMALWDGLTFRFFPGTASTAETTFNEGEERWVDYRVEIEIGTVSYEVAQNNS